MQVWNFYNGWNVSIRTLIDTPSNGAFMSKSQDDAYNLLEEMAMNNYQWSNKRNTPKKTDGMHEIDAIIALTTPSSFAHSTTKSKSTRNKCHPFDSL
jgi:hypothetical protein